jgi:adenosine deaminase
LSRGSEDALLRTGPCVPVLVGDTSLASCATALVWSAARGSRSIVKRVWEHERVLPGVAALPKAELHCHLDGILDLSMLRALRERGVNLPVSEAQLATAYPVHDFGSFLGWFASQQPLAGKLALYKEILREYVERLRAQNAVYAEVMVASGELPLDPGAALDAAADLRAYVNTLERGEIQVELLVAWGRNRPLERAQQIATRNIRLFEAGVIVGVALAGPEEGFPVAPLAPALARYHEAGVKIEIHAAEWCGPEAAWDAVEHGFPDRIGHGTHIFDDPRLVDLIAERRLHIEMCPTSNLHTGGIARIEDHPILRARERGLSVSVNTDDPGAFRCSLAGEYAVLAERFGFSLADLRDLTADALSARFAPTLRIPAAIVAVHDA